MADYKVWVYCDPVLDICASAEAWAAWAGAGFASVAIVVSFLLLRKQLGVQEALHRDQLAEQRKLMLDEMAAQRELQSIMERERDVMYLNRALLATDGYLNAIRDYHDRLSQVRPGPGRHYNFPVADGDWIVPLDQDSLAFLVHRGAQKLLNEFSVINKGALEWGRRVAEHARAMQVASELLEPIFNERHGQPLDLPTIVAAVGHAKDNAMRDRTRDLEEFTNVLVADISESLSAIRAEVKRLYPGALLPEPDAGWLVPPPVRSTVPSA